MASDTVRIPWAELDFEKDEDGPVELGRGASGAILAASWRNTAVAVKVMHTDGATLPESMVAAFEAEAARQRSVVSSYVVPVFGTAVRAATARAGPKYAIVMERAKISLFHRLAAPPPLGLGQRLRMARHVARGLNFLHGRDVVHGDMKSLNVLLDEDDNAKLTDFGLAEVRQSALSTVASRASVVTNGFKGTVEWSAPEMFGDAPARANKATDAYALGIVLWELFSGRRPYDTLVTNVQLLQAELPGRVRDGARPDLDALVPETPSEVRDLITRLWAASPGDRPSVYEASRTLDALTANGGGGGGGGSEGRTPTPVPPRSPASGAAATPSQSPPPVVYATQGLGGDDPVPLRPDGGGAGGGAAAAKGHAVPTGVLLSQAEAAVGGGWGLPIVEVAAAYAFFEEVDANHSHKVEMGESGPLIARFGAAAMMELPRVWKLADIDQDGALDRDEFTVAVHLLAGAGKGEPIPAELPERVVPPSKRAVWKATHGAPAAAAAAAAAGWPTVKALMAAVTGMLMDLDLKFRVVNEETVVLSFSAPEGDMQEDYDVIIRVNTEQKSFAYASLQARHEKGYPRAGTDIAELSDAVARANFGLSVGNFDLDPEDDPTLRVVFNVIMRVYGVDETFDMPGYIICVKKSLEVLVDTWKRYAPAFLNVARKGRPGAASVRAVEGS